MKCVHCNRPLTKAAFTIATRSGPRSYGPKCARMLLKAANGKKGRPRAMRVHDTKTLDLFEGTAA